MKVGKRLIYFDLFYSLKYKKKSWNKIGELYINNKIISLGWWVNDRISMLLTNKHVETRTTTYYRREQHIKKDKFYLKIISSQKDRWEDGYW